MLAKNKNERQIGFYSTFEEQLSHQHPLYVLAGKIHWEVFEQEFGKLYSREGRPAKPIRLMVSLLMLALTSYAIQTPPPCESPDDDAESKAIVLFEKYEFVAAV